MSLKLETGKTYLSRRGEPVSITGADLYSSFPFEDEYGRTYTPQGRYCINTYSQYDLVSEVPDPADHKPITNDPVNKPTHYTAGGIECIDALEAQLTPEEFQGFLKGNAVKYIWRCNHKGNPKQDLQKAVWYLNRLINKLEENDNAIQESPGETGCQENPQNETEVCGTRNAEGEADSPTRP